MKTTGMPGSPKANPFHYSGPVQDLAAAIPRPSALANVTRALARNEYVAVLAPCQTGKSTFLHQLRESIGRDCVYVDLAGVSHANLDAVAEHLAQAAGVALRSASAAGGVAVLRVLDTCKGPRGWVWLIDELGSLKHLAGPFLELIRVYYIESAAVKPASRHKFVIAGSADLADLALGSGGPSPFNVATQAYLNDFGREEVREFIGRLGGGPVLEGAADRIFELTCGHPYLVQYLCRYLYDSATCEVDTILANLETLISESNIETSVNVQGMVDHLFESGHGQHEELGLLEQILSGQSINFVPSSRAIRRLYVDHGCVRNEQGRCVIRNPIYRRVLERRFQVYRITRSKIEPPTHAPRTTAPKKARSLKPKIFIASSVEGKDVADALQYGLNPDARCTVWHQAFPLSQTTLDTLLRNCADKDFAIFIFSPDDLVTIRRQQYEIARDNVLFEAGLFMGMHGKERGFIVTPEGNPSFHVPTDLLGFTAAPYDADWARTEPIAALGPVVTQIRLGIRASSWSLTKIDITAKAVLALTAAFPLKLRLSIQNNQDLAVVIESNGFEYTGVPPAPNAELKGGSKTYSFQFLVGKDASGKDLYAPSYVLAPGRSVVSWVPIDPSFGVPALEAAMRSQNSGILRYRCIWLSEPATTQKNEDAL